MISSTPLIGPVRAFFSNPGVYFSAGGFGAAKSETAGHIRNATTRNIIVLSLFFFIIGSRISALQIKCARIFLADRLCAFQQGSYVLYAHAWALRDG